MQPYVFMHATNSYQTLARENALKSKCKYRGNAGY